MRLRFRKPFYQPLRWTEELGRVVDSAVLSAINFKGVIQALSLEGRDVETLCVVCIDDDCAPKSGIIVLWKEWAADATISAQSA